MWVCTGCDYENEEEDVTCAACDEPRPAEQPLEDDEDPYHNICVGKVVECRDAPNAALKLLKVDVSTGVIDVVTNATNVKEGQHIVVACVGAEIHGETVKKTQIKGFASHGMVCDAPMVGWTGGGAGAALVLPESFPIGSKPPTQRPRGDAAGK